MLQNSMTQRYHRNRVQYQKKFSGPLGAITVLCNNHITTLPQCLREGNPGKYILKPPINHTSAKYLLLPG